MRAAARSLAVTLVLAPVAAVAAPAPPPPSAPAPAPAPGPSGTSGRPDPSPTASDDPSLASWAGAAESIDLPTLLALAIRQSPALAGAALDIAVAEAAVDELAGLDDWRLTAELEGSSASRSIAGISVGRQTDLSLAARVGRALPSGGSIAFGASMALNDTSRSDREWTDTITASISHPLLRGRGRAVARAQVERAAIARDQASLARQAEAIAVIQELVRAYWDLVYAERDLAISRASLDLARERLRLTEAGIRGGKIAPSEALAVEQIIATRQEQVLGSELTILDRSIALRRLAGMPIGDGQLGLSTSMLPADVGTAPALSDVLARAIAESPELAQLAAAGRDATIAIALAEDGLLPRLDAALTLGPLGIGSFGEAAKGVFTADSYFVAGSLTLEHDLGQRAPRAQAHAARLAREQVRVNADDVRMQLAEAVARSMAQRELARQRLGLSRRAIELAERNIAVEQSRFDLGRSTSFDILQRQDELRSAQLREARAQIDGHLAELTLMALTAELLPAYGLSLEAPVTPTGR